MQPLYIKNAQLKGMIILKKIALTVCTLCLVTIVIFLFTNGVSSESPLVGTWGYGEQLEYIFFNDGTLIIRSGDHVTEGSYMTAGKKLKYTIDSRTQIYDYVIRGKNLILLDYERVSDVLKKK